MKTNTKASLSLVTLSSIKDRALSGFPKRDQARDVAKVLRGAASRTGGKVTVKQDVKDANGWSVQLVHNDGRGVLSLKGRA